VKRVSEDLFFLLFSRICFYLLEEGFFVVRSASTRRGAQHEAKIGEREKGSRGMATFNACTLFSPNRRIL
jgi:hypothetical protein